MTLPSRVSAEGKDARGVVALTTAIMIVSGVAALILIPSLLIGVAVALSGEWIGKLVAMHGMSAWLVLAWIPAALLAAVYNIVLGRKVLKQPDGFHVLKLLALSAFILAGFAALWYQWT